MKKEADNVLIITGGRIEDSFLRQLLSREQFSSIIAVDYGLAAVDRLGITPNYIVGDFDSVSEVVLERYREKSIPTLTFPKEKDKTDTQIALELAMSLPAAQLVLVGATGSRLDHTMANLHLLLLPLQQGIDACIIDENNKLYLKRESFRIERKQQHGNYVSLLPFGEAVSGLTLKGFYYPLDSILLTAGSSLGISNEIKEDEALVEFEKGTLLVIEARD
jgi:thiamine pyrophosphokinase